MFNINFIQFLMGTVSFSLIYVKLKTNHFCSSLLFITAMAPDNCTSYLLIIYSQLYIHADVRNEQYSALTRVHDIYIYIYIYDDDGVQP